MRQKHLDDPGGNITTDTWSSKLSVTDLARIGDVLGKRLESKGFDKAYVVLGQFLLLKKNKDLFVEWIKDLAGANTKQSGDCYQCLSDWCDEFL